MSMAQETIALSQIEKQRRGYLRLSLTNFDNLLEPEIAAGGRAEVGDSLFYASGNEPITGWAGIAVSTMAYIKLVPAGTTPDTCTAVFTDVAPVWSDSKQGYYGTGAAAIHRYIGGLYKDAAGNYAWKWLYEPRAHDMFNQEGSIIMAAESEMILPCGVWFFEGPEPGYQFYANDEWKGSGGDPKFSDGINFKITNAGLMEKTYWYRRFL